MNRSLDEVLKLGQSIWIDALRRRMLESGELRSLVEDVGLRGLTSNPTIFRDAIAGGPDYDAELEAQVRRGFSAAELYTELVVEDIQAAADVLRPVHDASARLDGYVSLEVSPALAHDAAQTVDEARRLWGRVARDNLMIKVPGTPEGIAALPTLLAEGINVNVTLIFAQDVYRRVAEAYLTGLEALALRGGALDRIASVASVFVSRVDALVDRQIEARARAAEGSRREALEALSGRVGIANARLIYQAYREISAGPRMAALRARGARPQRVLWASTSTKDPRLRDVVYVEELLGPETVSTLAPATLRAFLDHGRVRSRLGEDVAGARRVLAALGRAGISLEAIADELLVDGLARFEASYDDLMRLLEERRAGLLRSARDRLRWRLPPELERAVSKGLEQWRASGGLRRLHARDATLWTGRDESRWLDWLDVAHQELASLPRLRALADEVKRGGITRAVLLGMGGSSLFPEVLARTFPARPGHPALAVLDSTDPDWLASFAAGLDLDRAIFIVSSKSGATLETELLEAFFYDLVVRRVGPAAAGSRFFAVTDPGSKLEQRAHERGYAHVCFGVPGIGGRYSALSNFGMVPAAIMGVDVERLLSRACAMVQACASCVPPDDCPGVALGILLGVAAKQGRDKITLVASPLIAAFGAWLEQLLAESTGKRGTGLIPVDREPLGPPEVYGSDRVFVYLRLDDAFEPAQDDAVAALEAAGQPVVRLALDDVYDLGGEVYRWEMATAVAGSILGIDPFDQPDVEASKVEARRLLDHYERTGALPAEAPFFEAEGLSLYADDANRDALEARVAGDRTLRGYLRAHFARLSPGDYCALLAWIDWSEPHQRRLEEIRRAIRDHRRVATCLEVGPRYLHASGQAYKGGPSTGELLEITAEDRLDLPVPGRAFTFGIVQQAEARGDLEVLARRGRRLLRVHLGADVDHGLETLARSAREALAA